MATKAVKLEKSTYPSSHGAHDFECFGPPATEDGQFDKVKIADMGCFTQDGKDTCKYYHACVCKSKQNGKWYTYFEWGRTGATSPQFQMMECSSEAEAQSEFAKQCHTKNDKRGQWVEIAGKKRLQAKPGEDAYLVRALTTRSTGLPDAKSIKFNEGTAPVAPKPKTGAPARKVDAVTVKLMHDLNVATVKYTRGSMADSSIPTLAAIDDARSLLIEAEKRVLVVGDDVDLQVKDRDIVAITSQMYGRIPKKKALGAPPKDWILSSANISLWRQDLDAFESALKTTVDATEEVHDPFNGMNITMEHVPADSTLGKFLYAWWPQATANKHGNVGELKILNAWQVEQHDQTKPFQAAFEKIKPTKVDHRPLFQPKERPDVNNGAYGERNVGLMAHGTRSCNLTGILRERLRLPKQLVGVVISGAAFGAGCYFADDVKKSVGYTSLSGSLYGGGGGAVPGRGAFMFVADVILGQPHLAKECHGYTGTPAGTHCIFAKGGHTETSWGSGKIANNEWVIFERDQHQMRYLIEFTEGSKRRW